MAIDGSQNSENAFNYALQQMDRARDELFLLDVVEKIQYQLYAHAYVSMDFILDAQHKLDDHHKQVRKRKSKSGK